MGDLIIARRLALTAIAAVMAGSGLAFQANAALASQITMGANVLAGHHSGGGSGRRNNNTFTKNSPNWQKGYQHAATSNAGGRNIIQNSLCRNTPSCRNSQRSVFRY